MSRFVIVLVYQEIVVERLSVIEPDSALLIAFSVSWVDEEGAVNLQAYLEGQAKEGAGREGYQ
jgi:hypothetical protein